MDAWCFNDCLQKPVAKQVYNASKQYALDLRVCLQGSKLSEQYVNVHVVHGVQDEILKGAADAAVQRREAAEATAKPDERIAIQHAKAARAKDLRKKEVATM